MKRGGAAPHLRYSIQSQLRLNGGTSGSDRCRSKEKRASSASRPAFFINASSPMHSLSRDRLTKIGFGRGSPLAEISNPSAFHDLAVLPLKRGISPLEPVKRKEMFVKRKRIPDIRSSSFPPPENRDKIPATRQFRPGKNYAIREELRPV